MLAAEGYIRGYSTTDYGNGRTEFEIELKYFDNEPVIRQIERVSKPGRRVYAAVDAMPRVANGLGVTIISTLKGRDGGPCGARKSCRRRSPLQGLLTARNGKTTMSRVGKKPVLVPAGVTAKLEGHTVALQRRQGRVEVHRVR